MSAKRPSADDKKPTTVVANDPNDLKGELKRIGGSQSDHWNNIIANQTIKSLWVKHSNETTLDGQRKATVSALAASVRMTKLRG
jgi:hypothetical protein